MSRRNRESVAFSLFAFQDIITSVTGIMVLITLMLALELVLRDESSPTGETTKIVEQIQSTIADIESMEEKAGELKDRLSTGTDSIGDVAGFDAASVNSELGELDNFNHKLTADLRKIIKDQADAAKREADAENKRAAKAPDADRVKILHEQIQQKQQTLDDLKSSKRVIFNPTDGSAKTPWLVEVFKETILTAKTGVTAAPETFNEVDSFTEWCVNHRNAQTEYFVLLVKPDGIANYQLIRQHLKSKGFDLGYDLLSAEQVAIDPVKGAGAE
ncbi:hypothetical protein ACFL2H_03745 [Planctomycetota bacterium]